MTLIASLLESDEVTEHLRPHFVLLKDLLAAALQDAQARASRTKPLQPRRPAPLTAARVRPPSMMVGHGSDRCEWLRQHAALACWSIESK